MSLPRSRILVTNDDGINAPGLKILENIALSLSDDVWIVAPESDQSASSHSLTLTLPLRVRKLESRRFAVNGTPADSVLLGVQHIIEGNRPDLVLSGVNAGANLGEDVTYSGTVAAAMEGALLGIRSIALSQTRVFGEDVIWQPAEKFGPDIVRKLYTEGWPHNTLVNINFPNKPMDEIRNIEITVQGRRKVGDAITTGRDPRGYEFVWIGTERREDRTFKGSDVKAVHEGRISVTPLSLDLTDYRSMKCLQVLFT